MVAPESVELFKQQYPDMKKKIGRNREEEWEFWRLYAPVRLSILQLNAIIGQVAAMKSSSGTTKGGKLQISIFHIDDYVRTLNLFASCSLR